MAISLEQLQQFGRAHLSMIVLFLVVIAFYFLLNRGLRSLLAKELVGSAIYVFIRNTLKWSLILFFTVVILQNFGLKVSNIIAGLLTILGMVAVGFIAVWSVLSNILCSFLLITFDKFQVGDVIEILEPGSAVTLRGRVVGVNLMYTTLVEDGGGDSASMLTQVPNNVFFQKVMRRRPATDAESLSQHMLKKPLLFWAGK